MKMVLDKEDIKGMFGPLSLTPGIEVYVIDKEGKKVEFDSLVVEARLTKKGKKEEKAILEKMFA